MRIEQIRLRNFKMFQDVTVREIQPFTVLVGANGSGKSTFFDVFGFLRDCLKDNVRSALARRGGFREVVTRGHEAETILIELKLRMPLRIEERDSERTVKYLVEIASSNSEVRVAHEQLRYTRFGGGQPFRFIDFRDGAGSAINNEPELAKGGEERREDQRLDSRDILAIKGLGQFQRFEAASAIRNLIENWHVSDFHISAARTTPDAGVAEHLSGEGENLPLVAQFLYENHRKIFDEILSIMRRRVPGISDVEARQTEDGRIVLRFQDGSFKDPFIARFVSDGTIKMFAYLVFALRSKTEPAPLRRGARKPTLSEPHGRVGGGISKLRVPRRTGVRLNAFTRFPKRGSGEVTLRPLEGKRAQPHPPGCAIRADIGFG
jgi:predicted ATPase